MNCPVVGLSPTSLFSTWKAFHLKTLSSVTYMKLPSQTFVSNTNGQLTTRHFFQNQQQNWEGPRWTETDRYKSRNWKFQSADWLSPDSWLLKPQVTKALLSNHLSFPYSPNSSSPDNGFISLPLFLDLQCGFPHPQPELMTLISLRIRRVEEKPQKLPHQQDAMTWSIAQLLYRPFYCYRVINCLYSELSPAPPPMP